MSDLNRDVIPFTPSLVLAVVPDGPVAPQDFAPAAHTRASPLVAPLSEGRHPPGGVPSLRVTTCKWWYPPGLSGLPAAEEGGGDVRDTGT